MRWAPSSLLVLTLTLTACAGPGPAPTSVATVSPSPHASPTPPPIDYNARLGSSRVAAEASLAAARLLFKDKSFWEIYVKTVPQVLPTRVDPTDPGSLLRAAAPVTQVDLVMATESSQAILLFRNGGPDREKAILLTVMEELQHRFPGASKITCAVFYGESHQHASGVLAGGTFDYMFLDKL